MSLPAARTEPFTRKTAVERPLPALRVAVIVRLPEVSVTAPAGALPEAALMVTVTVEIALGAMVERLDVTVTVVKEFTLTVTAGETDGTTTVGVEVSPPYLAVMVLLPHISEVAGKVRLAIPVLPDGRRESGCPITPSRCKS